LVTLHDGVVSVLVDTILAEVLLRAWREKQLWALKSLLPDLDVVTSGELIRSFGVT
jgi:hypothetical protein